MISQCIGALCTLGIIVIAILVITRRVSFDDALKSIGKAFLLMLVLYFAVCMIAEPVQAGFIAIVTLLAKVVRWFLGVVLALAAVLLLIRMLSIRGHGVHER